VNSSYLITDDEIVKVARIVTPTEVAQSPAEAAFQVASLSAGRMRGAMLQIVKWPDGVTALVDADPADEHNWKRLLVRTYRAARSGVRGPVSLEA
jgi:hypothetical protein